MIEYVALDDVIKIDRTPASEEECRVLPYVGLEHIEKEIGDFVFGFGMSPEKLLATKFRFTPQHVLYGKLRPYLNKVVIPSFEGVCTTEILPLLPRDGRLDRRYLYAVLMSPTFVAWASASVSGANLPRLDPGRLVEFQFPLPSMKKQRGIGAAITKIGVTQLPQA